MDPPEMRARVAAARVARLATVTPAGLPHIVPCCFVLADDTVFTAVDGKPKSTAALQRLANLEAHPVAALLVDHYDDDWTALWWVRVDGPAHVVDDRDTRERALTALQAKYAQYRTDPPRGAVIALTVETWRGWSYDDPRTGRTNA
jgi:PPOX class probable F420-dependent enzyme